VTGLRLGVLASGRGSDLQSLLDAHASKKIASQVVVVISDKADAQALDRARKNKIPAEAIVPSADLQGEARRAKHEEQIGKVLDHYKVDLVVLAGYMRIVSPYLIRKFPNRIINIHPALLPAFPGVHGQDQALQWGARIAGCTTHFVDEDVDHGPIILQAAVVVRRDDSAEALSERILAVEHQLLPRTVQLIEQGHVRIDGRIVRIETEGSWTKKHPALDGVLYGDGY
jgi:phosphoribosylglycinamide formyltransferase-1